MRRRLVAGLLTGLLLWVAGTGLPAAAQAAEAGGASREVVFQVSTIGALLEGSYDGEMTLRELSRYGDFGIGTFEGLEGEMVQLGGRFWRVRADGRASPVPLGAWTPFAVTTFFEADLSEEVEQPLGDLEELERYLDGLRTSPHLLCAIRIEGEFAYVKTRSVPRQSKPYRPLAEIVQEQPIFEFEQVRGVLVGFWLPAALQSVNVAGYHLHFLTEDRQGGGHLLEARLTRGRVEMDTTREFHLRMPAEAGEAGAAVSSDLQEAVQQIER